jgi:predicted phosphodiesterase
MIGILSDAHGNIDAFRTAILHMRGLGAETFYFLGDAVGYIPSIEVVDELLSMGSEVKCVLGNHEQMLLQGGTAPEREPIYQHQLLRDGLSAHQIDFLKSWPTHRRETVNGTKVLFVHGSPSDYTNEYVYPDTDLDRFHTSDSFVFMGHSHYPFVRSANGTTFVNVGSCGLPRDDGRFGSFVTFDPAAKSVRINRYSIEKSVAELCSRSLTGVHPAVLQVFKRRSDLVSDNIPI